MEACPKCGAQMDTTWGVCTLCSYSDIKSELLQQPQQLRPKKRGIVIPKTGAEVLSQIKQGLKLLFMVVGVICLGLIIVAVFTNDEPQVATKTPPVSQSAPTNLPTTKPATEPETVRHNTPLTEIRSNPAYWNLAWQGREAELQWKTKEINKEYFKTHIYIKGQTDCNDMAIDIWNMLQAAGIVSIIVVGNLDLDDYTFAQCNHVWLRILAVEIGGSKPKAFVLEPTNGEVYFADDLERNPELNRYLRGFSYVKPSDLRADSHGRW